MRGVVAKKRHLFDAYHEISDDDLIQEGMQAALLNHQKYDPRKGAAYSTWIYRVVSCRLLDLRRVRARRAERERVVGESMAAFASETAYTSPTDYDPLAAWLAETYETACRMAGPQPRRRCRQWYTPAQAAACLLLRDRLHLSYRGMEMLLRQRPQLRRAMEMERCPSYSSISRFCCKLKNYRNIGVE